MRRSTVLTKLQNEILEQLKHVQFATIPQLAYLCNSHNSHVTDAAGALNELGFIDETSQIRPKVLFLTTLGGRLVDVPMPSGRRHSSWSVMAHACHLNVLREHLAKTHDGFRFYTRLELLKKGFNPGHGEHAAIDAAGRSWFVLLEALVHLK